MNERRIDGEFVTTMLARAHGGSVPQADADGIANFIGPMDNLVEATLGDAERLHELRALGVVEPDHLLLHASGYADRFAPLRGGVVPDCCDKHIPLRQTRFVDIAAVDDLLVAQKLHLLSESGHHLRGVGLE